MKRMLAQIDVAKMRALSTRQQKALLKDAIGDSSRAARRVQQKAAHVVRSSTTSLESARETAHIVESVAEAAGRPGWRSAEMSAALRQASEARAAADAVRSAWGDARESQLRAETVATHVLSVMGERAAAAAEARAELSRRAAEIEAAHLTDELNEQRAAEGEELVGREDDSVAWRCALQESSERQQPGCLLRRRGGILLSTSFIHSFIHSSQVKSSQVK